MPLFKKRASGGAVQPKPKPVTLEDRLQRALTNKESGVTLAQAARDQLVASSDELVDLRNAFDAELVRLSSLRGTANEQSVAAAALADDIGRSVDGF